MARKEFTSKTKEAAWERSGGACEAEGKTYGLMAGVRCGEDLEVKGVEYDHINPDANSKDNSLENCCACCVTCHQHKTSNRDAALLAKTRHQRRSARGIKKGNGRGFFKPVPTAPGPLSKCRGCGEFLDCCACSRAA